MIDKQALLAHLHTRSENRQDLVHAIYHGLAQRIERGDFDTDGGPLGAAAETGKMGAQQKSGPDGAGNTVSSGPDHQIQLRRL